MPSVVIEVPSRETTPPTLADLFDGPVDDETVIDLAEEIHRRAKQAEVEGWPQPTGFLSDPFPELNDDDAPADQ